MVGLKLYTGTVLCLVGKVYNRIMVGLKLLWQCVQEFKVNVYNRIMVGLKLLQYMEIHLLQGVFIIESWWD